ncbi:MAG: amidohydrolase [Megasphaera sp.]|jgi:amidohydrolase|nr:amidohydrolase [Megasphaera sp.]MCH4188279.1 amidohydrolase [Megasphaera sp.]MCH4218031.1 amidohydrolase [Megasphaera sp.]
MSTQTAIKTLVKKYMPAVCELRRQLHEHPETSGEEIETAALLAGLFRQMGMDVEEHVAGGHGVIATLHGNEPGKTIALRADMDALPMAEETGLPFSSHVAGKMHACGHDGHMSIMVGAAKVLNDLRHEFKGTVKFLCQPSEEKSPVGGAKAIVASKALDGIDGIYAIHVWPTLPTGTIGVLPGPMMAASDHISITIHGKSSHAAMPHKGIDAIVLAAQFITAAQTIVSRQINPLYPAVLTFGTIAGGDRYNVVADKVELAGTCRTYQGEAQDMAEAQLQKLLAGLDMVYGTTSELQYERGYAAVVNTPESAAFIAKTAEECFGPAVLAPVREPAMTAEDFSALLNAYGGGFYWLGATKPGEAVYPLHSNHFAVDEAALPIGMELMAALVLKRLQGDT